jgi:hypothetical protein
MMESSSAVTSLVIDKVESADEVPAGTKLYLFGSCLSPVGTPDDLDVLLVYRDGELGSARHISSLSQSARSPNTASISLC